MERNKKADWIDQTLFVIRHSELIPEQFRYDHILIDEAQDLSLAQMKAIMLLYRKDMMVAMDMNQKIHSKSWTPKQLGIESTTKKLTKSMRTTKEIDALAESVRRVNDAMLSEDDKSLRAIPERSGRLPRLVCADNLPEERKCVVTLVEKLLKSHPNGTIGIIAAKNDQISLYSNWLSSKEIKHQQIMKDSTFSTKEPGVKIVTAFGAKGLEFDCVIIPMFMEGNFPYHFKTEDEEEMASFLTKMRNLVYVSMTRAKHELYITWHGDKGSRFILDMDKDLYEAVGSPFEIKLPKKRTVKHVSEEASAEETPKVLAPPPPFSVRPELKEAAQDLVSYLHEKGLEVLDQRPKGGNLFVIGGKELNSIIKESKKKYSALWTYRENGGSVSGFRPVWFTKCNK